MLRSLTLTQSRLYRALDVFANFVALNLLWLFCCLPVITIYPATSAMFAVVRDWSQGEVSGATRPFFAAFAALARKSLLLECVWVPLGAFLALDVLIARQMPTMPGVPLLVILLPAAAGYVMTSVFLFPVLVSFDLGWRDTVRNALLLALSRVGTTALCLLVVGVAALCVAAMPVLVLLLGSMTAYVTFRLCRRAMTKALRLRG